MAISVTCEACEAQLKLKDELAGKRIKCPRCGGTTSVVAAKMPRLKTALAPKARETAEAPPLSSESRIAAPPALLALSCPDCDRKFKVKPDKAGKKLKCPECGFVVTAPLPRTVAPKETDDDGWIDITEAYEPPESDASADDDGGKKGPPVSGWGQKFLDDQEVPDEMQEQIHEAMTKTEQIVWCDRPQVSILLARAKKQRIMGIILIIVVTLIAGGFSYKMFMSGNIGPAFIPIGIGALFLLAGCFMITQPGRVLRNAAQRSCYVITNRRLLIHPGKGTQTHSNQGGNKVVVTVGTEHFGVASYTGLELMRLSRKEEKNFPGAGDLIFGATVLDEPAGGIMTALANVADTERLIRAKLIDPFIDKLLRGEVQLKEFGKPTKKDDDGEILPPEGNIKQFMEKDKDVLNADGNVKSFRSSLDKDLKKVPEDLMERVQAELTQGEKILWVDEPQGKTKGRGMLGAIVGSAKRKEPDYELYAITNRRVLLWCNKGTKVGNSMSWGKSRRGPLSYYPQAILQAGVENDKRIANGGGVIFKVVKVKIVSQAKKGGPTKVTYEDHYFGILRIRNVQAVARLLWQTLINPVRGA